MAINPGSDLLSDALAAADPQRAKAAEDRLASLSLAAEEGLTPEPFGALVIASTPQAGSLKAAASRSALENQPARNTRPGNPYEQFETVMLKSLFELMLPDKAVSVFGSGFAGEVCKSMLAQSLAEAAGHAKVAGIARYLEARRQRSKA